MSDSDGILAPGAAITLVDGSQARLRYGFLAIKQLEDEFGSLNGMQEALQREFSADKDGQPTGKAVGMAWSLLKAGLLDLELSEVELDRQIDMGRFPEYADAINKALTQAFGEPKGPKGQTNQKKPSRGNASTTSRPLSSVEPIASSGA